MSVLNLENVHHSREYNLKVSSTASVLQNFLGYGLQTLQINHRGKLGILIRHLNTHKRFIYKPSYVKLRC